MRKAILFIIMMLVCASVVLATQTYTSVTPANLYATTSTSVTFNWTATTDDITLTNMTTWLYLSAVNNDTAIQNQSIRQENSSWRNLSVTDLSVGFYKWYLVTNDSDGNTASLSRYFEVRDSDNQTDFRWENDTGFRAMTLNKDTGDLDVTGTINTKSINVTSNVGIGDYAGFTTNAVIASNGSNSWTSIFYDSQNASRWYAYYVYAPTDCFFMHDHISNVQAVFGWCADGPMYIRGPDGTIEFQNSNITEIDTAYFGPSTTAGMIDSPTGTYLRVGNNGTTSHSLATNDDLFISGELEVDGITNFDNKLSIHSNLTLGDESNYLLFEELVNGTYAVIKSYQDLDIYINPSGNDIRVPTSTNITWDNGAKISVNSTCIVLSSPAGTGEYAVCD